MDIDQENKQCPRFWADQRPKLKSQRISFQDVIFWNRTELRSVGPLTTNEFAVASASKIQIREPISVQDSYQRSQSASKIHLREPISVQDSHQRSQSSIVVVAAFLALVMITTMVTMATLVMVMVVVVAAVFVVTTIFTTTLVVVTTFVSPLFELLVTVLAVVVVVS